MSHFDACRLAALHREQDDLSLAARLSAGDLDTLLEEIREIADGLPYGWNPTRTRPWEDIDDNSMYAVRNGSMHDNRRSGWLVFSEGRHGDVFVLPYAYLDDPDAYARKLHEDTREWRAEQDTEIAARQAEAQAAAERHEADQYARLKAKFEGGAA